MAWLPSPGRASLQSEDGLIRQVTLIALTMGKMSFSPWIVPLAAVTQVGKSHLPSWSCSSAHRAWKSEGNKSQAQKTSKFLRVFLPKHHGHSGPFSVLSNSTGNSHKVYTRFGLQISREKKPPLNILFWIIEKQSKVMSQNKCMVPILQIRKIWFFHTPHLQQLKLSIKSFMFLCWLFFFLWPFHNTECIKARNAQELISFLSSALKCLNTSLFPFQVAIFTQFQALFRAIELKRLKNLERLHLLFPINICHPSLCILIFGTEEEKERNKRERRQELQTWIISSFSKPKMKGIQNET